MRMKTKTRRGDGQRHRRGEALLLSLLLLSSLSVLGRCSADGTVDEPRHLGGERAQPAEERKDADDVERTTSARRRDAEANHRGEINKDRPYRPVHAKTSDGSSHAHSFAASSEVVSGVGSLVISSGGSGGDGPSSSEPEPMMKQLHAKTSEADCARQYTPRSYGPYERVSNHGRNYHCKPYPFTGEF